MVGINAHDWVVKNAPRVQVPMLVFHSSTDSFANIRGSELLIQLSPSSDKELRRVDHMWHILTKEPGNEALRDQVAEWVAQQCGGGKGGSASGPASQAG